MYVHAGTYFHRTINSKHYYFLHTSATQEEQVSCTPTHICEGCCSPGNKISSAEAVKLTCFLLLAPTCYPALVTAADFVRKGRHADRLDDMAHCVRPRLAQLQQCNVVVVVPAVVVFVDYDPSHRRHKLRTALHLHPQVSAPRSGVSQSGWEQTDKTSLKIVPQNACQQQGRRKRRTRPTSVPFKLWKLKASGDAGDVWDGVRGKTAYLLPWKQWAADTSHSFDITEAPQ